MRKSYSDDDDNEVAAPFVALYRHAPKAVRQGCPADRIFHVVGRWKDGEMLAWKCLELPDGRIRHPSRWTKPMTLSELHALGNIRSAKNGAAPTAQFKPDSFYVKIEA
jgi:hypothetical protein